MTDGWGEDFDEDGNVIGDVPESGAGETEFFQEHWIAVITASVAWFLLNMPRVARTGDGVGVLIGGAIGSLIMGSLTAFVIVKLRKAI